MGISSKFRRKKYSPNTNDPNEALKEAREKFNQGFFFEAFDIYEYLADNFQKDSIEILSEVYDKYQLMENKDRYSLYQGRQFQFNIKEGDKVLDVGSGHKPFPYATHLADISTSDHQYGRAGVPFKEVEGKPVYEFNVEEIPFEDKEFEFVYCSHVLEHTEHPEKACEELMRIAKRGYIETPSRAKDLWLNSAKVSNHIWHLDIENEVLVFNKYNENEINGFNTDLLMKMHVKPETQREKAFSALIYLKPEFVNTMMLWENGFSYRINRSVQKHENPNTKYFYDTLYKGRWEIGDTNIPFDYENKGKGKKDFYMSLISLPFFNSGGQLLDVGCGLGGLLDCLPFDNKFDLYGIDFSTSAIEQISKRIKGNFVEGDVHNLPYENNFFDRIICTETLEHVDEPERVISEMFRVLKPGGQLLITVPEETRDLKPEKWPGGISLHINKFNIKSLVGMIKSADNNVIFSDIVKNEIWLIAEKSSLNIIKSDFHPNSGNDVRKGKLQFLQVHTFYQSYLNDFYQKNFTLRNSNYKDQIKALVDDGFSGIHIFAPYMNELGYNGELIIANNPYAQEQWLKENSIGIDSADDWQTKILLKQIEKIKPDILYLSDPITFDSKFIRRLSHKPKLIIGWRAADIPVNTDWSEFDVILSGLTGVRETALEIGAKSAEYFIPGFPTNLVDNKNMPQKIHDVVFAGSWTLGQHQSRNSLLSAIAQESQRSGGFNCGFYLSGKPEQFTPEISKITRPAVFGNEMINKLMSGKIVFDSRGDIRNIRNNKSDIAGNETLNMRLFEATGAGSFLLTEYKENLDSLFKVGEEIEVFENEKELLEKIKYYLKHDDIREEIALNGKKRCIENYSMSKRVIEFDKIIKKYLNIRKASNDNTITTIPDDKNINEVTLLLDQARKKIDEDKVDEALRDIIIAKSRKIKFENLDTLRAVCFIKKNQFEAARNSLLEELSLHENNQVARDLLNSLPESMECEYNDQEFNDILDLIHPFTMLSKARLYSLYTLAKKICIENLEGNFVECGVARGGSSALLAYVIKKYSKKKRLLFSFDTFEGMPVPTEQDMHKGEFAEDTGWGTGTCAAPAESLMKACSLLGVEDIVKPVQGLFQDTLPNEKTAIGRIAFLHMDGDWYESTKTIFDNLFDNISFNGFVQIDDYGYWEGCRQATNEFFTRKKLNYELHQIDSTGVWFQKNNLIENNIVENNNLTMLNLGCGSRYHDSWINIDFISSNENVIKFNLNEGVPFESNSADIIYHSHLLEHFPKEFAPQFIAECYRVLKPGGIIRVVVPDLERIARNYLQFLDEASLGNKEADNKYEWTLLELFDQMVRNYSGGEMLKYWKQENIPAKEFVIERMGSEAKNIIEHLKRNENAVLTKHQELSSEEIGAFRTSGEIHQWMYDKYSLSKMLKSTGFKEVYNCAANESRIPKFNNYKLDIENNGSIRKPDSLFIEAVK